MLTYLIEMAGDLFGFFECFSEQLYAYKLLLMYVTSPRIQFNDKVLDTSAL